MGINDRYKPALGVTDASIAAHDSSFRGVKGEKFKALVASTAVELDLNPGLLAAVLLAEDSRNDYLQSSGRVDGYPLGTDSYYETRRKIALKVPAARRVHILDHYDRFNEMGNLVTIAVFAAPDACLASGVYLKYKEVRVGELLLNKGRHVKGLLAETRFALVRLAFNPGPKGIRHWIDMVTTGEDILVRSGPSTQNRHHPQRGATIHAARAIHLSQAIFGVFP